MSNAQDGFLRNCSVWLPWSFLIQMCSEIYYAKLSMTIPNKKKMFQFLKYTYFFLHFTEFIKNMSHSSVLFWSSNIARLPKALSPCQGWSRTIVVNNAFFFPGVSGNSIEFFRNTCFPKRERRNLTGSNNRISHYCSFPRRHHWFPPVPSSSSSFAVFASRTNRRAEKKICFFWYAQWICFFFIRTLFQICLHTFLNSWLHLKV